MTDGNFINGFPDGFLWGAATSAYQIEGHPQADGAGENIWQRFARKPGRVLNNDNGDIACDHYHRYREDIGLMRDMNLNAYRFSIAWGRILPNGRGQVNRAGLSFYDRLVDTLLEQGITPSATLYHWELPAALDDRGGWMNRDIADWFADYAQIVFHHFDDRIPLWTTLNEPWVTMHFGYLHGEHAPGHATIAEAPVVAHNQLRAHARALSCYRAEGKHEIGIVVNLAPKYPATEKETDIAAATRADAYMNRIFLDPLFLGTYPEELSEMFGDTWPEFGASDMDANDMKEIQTPIDFLGINYYTRDIVADSPKDSPVRVKSVRHSDNAYTDIGWEVFPQGLSEILGWVTQRYGAMPIYVMENGAAYDDPDSVEDRPEWKDSERTSYLHEHIKAVHTAIQDGVDLRGYFVWSLLDNFEWAFGYSKRFGLVHVDYATQQRTLKSSALFYSDVIRSQGRCLFEDDE